MTVLKMSTTFGAPAKQELTANAIKARVFDNNGAGLYSAESKDVVDQSSVAGGFGRIDFGSVAENLRLTLEPSMEGQAGCKNPQGLLAASVVASFGGNLSSYLRMQSNTGIKSLEEGITMASLEGREWDSVYSAESFDNQNLIDNLAISIGLNYKIARQGPAMELFFRTIALSPDQGGVDILVPNLFVENLVRHATDGSPSDFGFRRVLDAAIDYTVLNDNSTSILPTHNSQTAQYFVPTALLTPFPHTDGRRTVTTSALAVQKEINLFGLGNLDTAARAGTPDYTEALDRNIGISWILLALGNTALRFDTLGLPYSRYVKTPEQNARGVKLNFDLTSLFIDADSVDAAGAELTGGVWDIIKNGKYTVRLRTTLNGKADVERGTITVTPALVEVMAITNELGDPIALSGQVGQSIITGFQELTVAGWWPDARLTNTNHRHLGLMLNTRPVGERLLSRTRSPFFVPYPVGEERDQTVMDQLTFAVGQFINNEAVGFLKSYHSRLMRLTNGGIRGDLVKGDFEQNQLMIEGIARHMINPYIMEVDVDLQDLSQSQETVANVENGTEVLVNAMRSVAFDILQLTGYENACKFVDGGEVTNKWKFICATSQKIKRFMSITGDSRTLGADLPYVLEADVDARMRDTLFMSLARDVDGIDLLSAGCMLLTPTLVSSMTVTRDNTPRIEAVVQPRFQHYFLLPILVKFNVTGVDELLEKTMPFRVAAQVTDADAGGSNGGTGTGTGGTGGTDNGGNGVDDGSGTGAP